MRSPSDPTATVPFRGHSPNILAGLVETISTKRWTSMRLVRTPPSHSSIRRVSMPGAPFGIFEKSPSPSFFSFMQNGQWSVETTWRSFPASPFQSATWFHFSRRGGDITYFAALEPRPLVVLVGEEQVLRAGLRVGGQPHVPRLLHLLQRVGAGEVDDVERHAGHLGQRDGAAGGLALRARGARERVVLGRGLALAQRLLDQGVDHPAVLGVHADEPAVLPRLQHGLKMVASSTMNTPG